MKEWKAAGRISAASTARMQPTALQGVRPAQCRTVYRAPELPRSRGGGSNESQSRAVGILVDLTREAEMN
jgi:hypothetical protein